jgi:large subunit ribosomal protein L30
MLRIKLVKSVIGNTPANRATVKALGLRKMHQTVTHQDNPAIRGMIHKVKHMLSVEEVKE